MNTCPLTEMLRREPVLVTGAGAFSAAGAGTATLWATAMAGRSAAQARDFVGDAAAARFAVCAAPEVDTTGPEMRPFRKMDRCVQMAFVAAAEAWRQADIAGAYAPERIGVMVGSSRGPLHRCGEGADGTSLRPPAPSMAAGTTFAAVSGALARTLGCKGPGSMVSATCASSAFAVAAAAEQIVLGNADAMLVGGAEAPLQPALLAQLQAAGVLGSHPEPGRTCRPFDLERNGMVLGEGSAFLVLESARTAAHRRAPALARLAGWAVGMDDTSRTGVNPQGTALIRVMQRALQVAGLTPGHVGYLNAHGTATRQNDAAEAQAVLRVFGDGVPCTSTKPITGHCLGATAALESILCIEALRCQRIPPTVNCETPDPLCPINVRPSPVPPSRMDAAMSNSLGFWGYHASLLFRVEPGVGAPVL